MKSAHWLVVTFCWMMVGTSTSTLADDDQATAAYGLGVHAYFDGHFDVAGDQLSQAIGDGTADPRPYYFRGIVRGAQGQNELAISDFRKGAESEQSFVGKSFDVDDALERIQGPVRIEIEKYRLEAAARAKEIRRKTNREVDQSFEGKGRAGNTPFDPRNLPDVSQIVDATIPFPDVSAKPYFPPTKVVDDNASAPIVPAAANAQPQGAPTRPTDDPFNTGNPAVPPAKDMKNEGDQGQKAPPADDPFGGGDKDPGAGEPEPSKDDGKEPEPNKDEGKEPEPSSGDESKPDSKNDPFGGG